jgi:hypothetical protein
MIKSVLIEKKPDVLNHGRAEYLSEDKSENEEMCELLRPMKSAKYWIASVK